MSRKCSGTKMKIKHQRVMMKGEGMVPKHNGSAGEHGVISVAVQGSTGSDGMPRVHSDRHATLNGMNRQHQCHIGNSAQCPDSTQWCCNGGSTGPGVVSLETK